MSERPALEEIFKLTKGAYWYRKWNWGSDLRLGSWDGVQVDEGGHVRVLDLRENYLQGTLEHVQFTSRLINLSTLVLSGNSIRGCIPVQLGKLLSLRVLDLSWNKLSGSIPEDIYYLLNLEVLRLDNNELSGELTISLGRLVNLENLNVSRNCLCGVIPDVGFRLTKLKLLNFSGNSFEGYVPEVAKEYIEMHYKFLS